VGRPDPRGAQDRAPAQPAAADDGAAAVQPAAPRAGRGRVRAALRRVRHGHHHLVAARLRAAHRQVQQRRAAGRPARAGGIRLAAEDGGRRPEGAPHRARAPLHQRGEGAWGRAGTARDRLVPAQPERVHGDAGRLARGAAGAEPGGAGGSGEAGRRGVAAGGGLDRVVGARLYPSRFAIAAPRSPGDFTVVTPAFSIAANLPSAVPAPPEAIAPAWPMRLPLGADAPAMKPTTGLVTCSAMYSAASSSAEPPISPTMMMPLVCSSASNSFRQSMKLRPLIGSPPIPITVDWPRPASVVCFTAS